MREKKHSENSKQFLKGKIMIAKILNKCQARVGICPENRMKIPKEQEENKKKKEYLIVK